MTTLHREEIRVRIGREGGVHEAVLVVLRSEGLEGIGEAALIPGRDAGAALNAAEECATIDLEARRLGVPMAELLGGVRRTAITCNALIVERAPAAVAARVEQLWAEGFRTFKLKTADLGGDLDLARLGAARFAGGRAAGLRIDFNQALDGRRAAAVLRSLGQFELEFVEQPLPGSAGLDSWLALQEQGPVAADESLANPELAAALALAGVGLAMKLATVGGPLAVLELAAKARGPVLLASSYETSIGLAAALQTACALPQEPLACGLATAHLLESDLSSGLKLEAGLLQLPSGPGLGLELDRELVERYRVER